MDVFIFNIGLISIGIGVAYNQLFGPAFYPGADIAVSSLLATIGMVFVAFTFYFWSVTFPRSGGAYVYLSRSFGPAAAFTLTFAETLVLNFYAALAASLVVSVGLGSLFTSVGMLSGSAAAAAVGTALSQPTGIFVAGSVVIILCGLLLISGMRRYFAVQKVMFIVALVGTAVALATMALVSRESFVANFNELMAPLTYDAVIKGATDGGRVASGFNWPATVAALVWPLLPLLGGIQSIGLGGEIKQVNRSQSIGMLGSILVSGAVFMLFAWLANAAFGYEFQGAVGYNAFVAPELSTPTTPYFTLLVSILSKSLPVTILVTAGFTAWIYFWVPAEMAYTNRTIIAWAFDRLAPEGMGYVSRRLHTPVVAIVTTMILSLIGLGLIAFTTLGTLVIIQALIIVWGLCMLAAVFFPYTRRDLYEKSPAARYQILGLPAMTVTGAISTVFMAWVFWMLWNDAYAAGHSPVAVGTIAGMFIAGLILYLGISLYRRKQGLKLERAFSEIPIE